MLKLNVPSALVARLFARNACLAVASLLLSCTPDAPNESTAGAPQAESSSQPVASSSPTSEPADSAPAPFRDVTTSVGIDFVHVNGATGGFFLPEIMGAGCALFDFDGDGDLDVYALQGAPLTATRAAPDGVRTPGSGDPGQAPVNRLFRSELANSSVLKFVDVTTTSGVGDQGFALGCAVGDYDNDGFADLYVTNFGANVLFHNQGDGTFRDVTESAGVGDPGFAASAAFFDYDRDGWLDIYVVNYVEYSLAANRDCTRFGGVPDYCGPMSYEPASDRVFRNRGDGTFDDVTIRLGVHSSLGCGLGVVCADWDNDGWIDVFVANDATPNHLWLNREGRAFEEAGLLAGVAVNRDGKSEAGMGIATADFDRDGDFDVFLTHEVEETNTYYVQRDEAFFDDATAVVGLAAPSRPYSGFGTYAIDYDLDGWLDLFVANGAVRRQTNQVSNANPYVQPNQLYRNLKGRFVEQRPIVAASAALASRGAAFGDLDHDGDVDIVVANNAGPLQVLVNDAAADRAWVRLRLQGTRAAKDAYGARVEVQAGGVSLKQIVGTDGSYCSASDVRRVFGLDSIADPVVATVTWLGGGVERWKNIPLRSETLLRQGEGEAVE